MIKKAGFIFFLMVAFLFVCGTAMTEGQTNPRRKHVKETIQWQNDREGFFRNGDLALTVTCDRMPMLSEPGKFTVTVKNDDGSDWRFEYGICDTGRDPNGYIYFSNATESNVFDGFAFCTPGEYRLYVFLFRAGNMKNRVAKASYSFTVAEEMGYPTLEEKAQEIVDECRAGTDWQTALNLHDWLTGNTYYDQNYEYYGVDVLFRGKGVCDAYSKAFRLLCNTAGITAERVTSNAQNHAWNVIKFGDTWYQTDVTWDDPVGGTNAVSGKEHHCYYCLSDDVMYLDHTRYDASYDPGCPSMAMNYYLKTDTWQVFGNYNSGNTVIGFFLNEIDGGNTKPEFYLENWEYYWPGDNYGYYMGPIRYSIYAEGMKMTDWTLENGGRLNVNIELYYSDGLLSLHVAGWDIEETGTLILPVSVKTIDENAFEKTKATTVMIPEGCTAIGSCAFLDSGVRTVYAPDSLTSIADDAFEGCGRVIFFSASGENDALAEYAEQAGHLVIEP